MDDEITQEVLDDMLIDLEEGISFDPAFVHKVIEQLLERIETLECRLLDDAAS